MKHKIIWFVLSAVLLLNACGGAATTSLEVVFAEFAFTPNTFTVPAGQEITVHIVNNGALVHDFAILQYGTDAGDDFDAEDQDHVYWEVEVDPGKETTVTFTAPSEAGEYQIVCGVPGHYMAGMVGILMVVAEE